MTKGGNGNTGLTTMAVADLDRIEHLLDGLLHHLQTAPVLAEALADAIRVLSGVQAELAADIAVPGWFRSLPAAPGSGRTLAQPTGEVAASRPIRNHAAV